MIFMIVHVLGFPLGDGVDLGPLGFLVQMTLMSNCGQATLFSLLSCVPVRLGSRALRQGAKFFTPASFGSFSLAWSLLVPVDVIRKE